MRGSPGALPGLCESGCVESVSFVGVLVFSLRRLCFPISWLFYAARRAPHTLVSLLLRFGPSGVDRDLEVDIIRRDGQCP